MITKVQLKCESCNKEFERVAAEVTRNKKKSRRVYCSLACAGKVTYKNCPLQPKGVVPVSLKGHAGNRKDQFSPFRYHMKCVKQRDKEYNISLSDLKEQWDKQSGRCPYTGWLLDNPVTCDTTKFTFHPRRASLDRIDSSKGYMRGNIQFVSLMAQYAKHEFTEDQLYEFCEQVTEHRKN